MSIYARTDFAITKPLKIRFNSKLLPVGDCLEFSGAIRNGFGVIKHEGRTLSAHVVAFVMNGGRIRAGEVIVQTCGNALCCNPHHLETVSAKERLIYLRRKKIFEAPKGEALPQTKLTEADVRKVIELRIESGKGARTIAKKLGLPVEAVFGVLSGRTWKHVSQKPKSRPLMIPSYCHHKPSNQAFVRIRGKDYYLGIYGTSKSYERYESLIAQYRSEHETKRQSV